MRYNFVQSEWAVIEEFPKYEINSLGIIRKRSNKVVISVQVYNYETVMLTKDGKRYHRSVKSLVETTFPETIQRRKRRKR